MSDPAQVLRDFQPGSDFFIGIDSDGCVFDSMEIKHKECFVPMFVKHNGLQAVSKYARQVWEFVNLYSKTRGTNRFPAMVRSLELLRERPEVQARNVNVPSHPALDEWMARETKLGNATLAAEVAGGNDDLARSRIGQTPSMHTSPTSSTAYRLSRSFASALPKRLDERT